MATRDANDISIGQDAWIEWVALDDRCERPFDLDELIEPIWPFLALLETDCVAECCGIAAFNLWPDSIVRAANELSDAELQERIIAVRDQVLTSSQEVFASRRLNNLFAKRVLLQLLEHLARHVSSESDAERASPAD